MAEFEFTDSPTLNLSQTGGVLKGDVIIDPDPLNALTETSDGLMVTPSTGGTVPNATVDARGIVELATDAETGTGGLSGVDATRAVTPSNLSANRDYDTYPDTDAGLNHTGVVQQADGNKYRLRWGPGYYEHAARDMMSLYFTAGFGGLPAGTFHDFVLPIAVSNPVTMRPQVTDANYGSVDRTMNSSAAVSIYCSLAEGHTSTTLALGYINPVSTANPSGVTVFIPNART